MRKRIFVLTVLLLCVLVAAVSLVLGAYLSNISMPYKIGPGASMSAPVVLNMTADNGGTIIENSTGGSGPLHNGVPVNANSTLTLPELGNVTIAFANATALSPFTAFACTVQLYATGSPVYTGLITNTTLTYTILNVAAGTYPIYVGYSFTAGSNPATGTITVNVTSP